MWCICSSLHGIYCKRAFCGWYCGGIRNVMDDNSLSHYYYVILEDWSISSAIVLICASIVYFIYAILFAFMNAIPVLLAKAER